MLTRTLYRKIEDEDRTVELKITEFSWWTTVNILRTYFVDKMLPLIKNMGDDEDTQVLDLIQKFLTSADQDLVDRFTKEFLARVFYRIAGQRYKKLEFTSYIIQHRNCNTIFIN